MLGFFCHEEEVSSIITHSNGYPSAWHSTKWKRQNCHLMSLPATGECPRYPWRKSLGAIHVDIIAIRFGIVEVQCAIKGLRESKTEVSIELQMAFWSEKGTVELHVLAEVYPVAFFVLRDALVSITCCVKSLEHW